MICISGGRSGTGCVYTRTSTLYMVMIDDGVYVRPGNSLLMLLTNNELQLHNLSDAALLAASAEQPSDGDSLFTCGLRVPATPLPYCSNRSRSRTCPHTVPLWVDWQSGLIDGHMCG